MVSFLKLSASESKYGKYPFCDGVYVNAVGESWSKFFSYEEAET